MEIPKQTVAKAIGQFGTIGQSIATIVMISVTKANMSDSPAVGEINRRKAWIKGGIGFRAGFLLFF